MAGRLEAQRGTHQAGFPCPQPLVGPEPPGGRGPLRGLVGTAEALVPDGTVLPPRPDAPELFAAALARLVTAAPSAADVPPLPPAPSWNGWDHADPRPWPCPDDTDVDLNDRPGPGRPDETARRVRTRLRRAALPEVIGHGGRTAVQPLGRPKKQPSGCAGPTPERYGLWRTRRRCSAGVSSLATLGAGRHGPPDKERARSP